MVNKEKALLNVLVSCNGNKDMFLTKSHACMVEITLARESSTMNMPWVYP